MSETRQTIRFQVLRPRHAELPATEEQELQRELAAAVPDLDIERMFLRRPGLLASYEHLVLARTEPGGALAGLLGCGWQRCAGLSMLCVRIQMVGPAYRRTGLFGGLWRYELSEVLPGESSRPSVVAVKSYNPMVYLAMRTIGALAGGRLYPRVDGGRQHAELARLASSAGTVLAAGHPFDPATGVLRGVGLPPDLYHRFPALGNDPAGGYFQRLLRPGDRMLCLLRLPGFDDPDEAARLFDTLGARLGARVPAST